MLLLWLILSPGPRDFQIYNIYYDVAKKYRDIIWRSRHPAELKFIGKIKIFINWLILKDIIVFFMPKQT